MGIQYNEVVDKNEAPTRRSIYKQAIYITMLSVNSLILCLMVFSALIYGQAELVSEKFRYSLSDPNDKIISAQFNSDGSKILVLGRKSAEIVSTDSGKMLTVFEGDLDLEKKGYDFAWQPNGSKIIQFHSRSYLKKSVATLWNADTGKIVSTIEELLGISSVEWSSNGKWILSVGGAQTDYYGRNKELSFTIRDEDGVKKNSLLVPANQFHSVQFSASGEKFIGSFKPLKGRKPIRIYDAETGNLEKEFDIVRPPKTDQFTYPIFAGESPDGKYICGQIDLSKGVVCWDTDDETKPAYLFLDNKASGNNLFLDFSGDSKNVAILRSKEKMIEVADTSTGNTKFRINLPNKINRVRGSSAVHIGYSTGGNTWSQDGKFYIVSDIEKEVSIWDALKGEKISSRPSIWETSYDWYVGTIPVDYELFSFNAQNGLLLSKSIQTVRVWDPQSGEMLHQIGEHLKNAKELTWQRLIAEWSPKGEYLLAASDKNKSIVLWSVNR